jgi:hypothetical protein
LLLWEDWINVFMSLVDLLSRIPLSAFPRAVRASRRFVIGCCSGGSSVAGYEAFRPCSKPNRFKSGHNLLAAPLCSACVSLQTWTSTEVSVLRHSLKKDYEGIQFLEI